MGDEAQEHRRARGIDKAGDVLMTRRLACSIALTFALVTTTAFAQDPQKMSAAQVLFDGAVAEMGKGRHAAACPKLEEAQRLLPEALGIKEQLALCYEGAGRLASAWSQWRVLEDLAGKANQGARLQLALQHIAALRPRLATITVEVPKESAAIAGLGVKRDGLELGPALWGTEVPVDSGPHEVTAAAPGRAPFTEKVSITADGQKISVRIAPLATAPSGQGTAPEAPAPEAPAAQPSGWQRPLGIAAIGVGAAGVAVGAVLGGIAIAKKDESNAHPCNAFNECLTAEGAALRNEARRFGDAATVAIIAGGVLAAGGVTLVLLAPKATKTAQGPVAARLRAAPGGLVVEGRF
jgi:hypothetical protein